MIIKAVIIDDEIKSIEILKLLLKEFIEGIEVVAQFEDSVKALDYLKHHHVDLVFSDINMPNINGIDLVDLLAEQNISIVFISAHKDFAFDAIKRQVLDYLLKPIDLKDLIKAIEKARLKLHQFHESVNTAISSNKITIPVRDGFKYANWADIVYLKADSNYTKFHFSNGEHIMSAKTLKYYEALLPQQQFARIHESYIININKVERYIKGDGGQVIMNDKTELEVSRRRKELLMEILGNN
jgi:two-component system, LytTR family, response regulator